MIDKSESFIQKLPTQLLGNSISPTNRVRNLGVTFNSGNTFTSHITKVCCAYYYHLKDLRCIRKYLSVKTAALLANSMISSRLDHCNFLLCAISKYNVAKLQKIQTALCRIIFRFYRTSHATPFLQTLHWLPITYHILFIYNLITFKATKFSQPTYLSSLIKPVASLIEIGYLFPKFVLEKPLVGEVLQWLPPLNGTNSPNQSDDSTQ